MSIPLRLVTGFLGAGKTTLLEHLVASVAGPGVVFLVNEFAPRDVDGGRLHLEPGRLTTVVGGSIFCKCKVSDFISQLGRIAERNPEAVVVETSGIADPTVLPRMLEETGLGERFALAGCACVVDPGSFAKVLLTLPNVAAQVRSADLVVVNKVDLHEEATIEACCRQVAELNPAAVLHRAVRCQVDHDWFALPTVPGDGSVGDYARCVDPNYITVVASVTAPVDLPRLQAACDALGDDLYRVKGTIPTTAGPIDIDRSTAGWQQRSGREPGALVLIGVGAAAGRLQQLAATISQGAFTVTVPTAS